MSTFSSVFSSGGTTYPNFDNFNRVIESVWTRTANFYDETVAYGLDSEVTQATDAVLTAPNGDHQFDVVYTGLGALNWLPDIRSWAKVVAALLRPGGVLHLHEGHPMLWSMDQERADDVLAVRYPYFETAAPIISDDGPRTYTDGDTSTITNTAMAEWNHGLGEVVQGVLDAGLVLTKLEELQYCDWLAIPAAMTLTDDDGAAVLVDRPEMMPLSYTLQARRPL